MARLAPHCTTQCEVGVTRETYALGSGHVDVKHNDVIVNTNQLTRVNTSHLNIMKNKGVDKS